MASTGPIPAWLMVVAALGGLPFTWGIAYSLYLDNKQQKNWIRVGARVIRSGVKERTRNVTTQHQPDVRYEYWVNGRRYESDWVGGGAMYYASKSDAQRQAEKYPAGASVMALVNPDQPEQALLEWGHAWWTIALTFLLGLAWASAWLAAWYSTYLGPFLRRHEWIR